MTVESSKRSFNSSNVIAKISGSAPELKHECIVYSAHWDHFGKEEKGGEVGIYSGALDNGSGVAVILEIARAVATLTEAPRRTILFFFPSLEEYGLLGSNFYVHHPSIPIADTAAIINVDVMNPWGRTRKIVSIAQGHCTLDEVLETHARQQNRSVTGDPQPEKGYFFRSDHLEFVRKGVPALFFLNPGLDFIGKPTEFGDGKRDEYLKNGYHKFGDKVDPAWDLSGMVEDAQLLFLTGLTVADSIGRPKWKATSEFASK